MTARTPKPRTLAEIKRAAADEAARKALAEALAAHGETDEGAASLGLLLTNFRREAKRYGLWSERAPGRPKRP